MAPTLSRDRLIRKETALGLIREIVPPTTHMGLTFCPWLEVESDEVVFDYARGLTDGLAPARAEDASSELAQKDDTFAGQGRASVIDWSLKDRYVASDVTRYRELLAIQESMTATGNFPFYIGNMTEDYQEKLARDTLRRRRMLDNRIEWMCMTPLDTGGLAYNDGKVKFTVDYVRPALQQTAATGANAAFYAGGTADLASSKFWTDVTNGDPIADITRVQEYMYALYGVRITRAIASRKAINSIINTSKFIARSGMVGTGVDPRYLIDGWGPEAAKQVVQQQTGLTFIEYDTVYRTRPIGGTTPTSNRFTNEKNLIFLPDEADITEFDDTEIGFGKMLTSPHPEGNFQSGFYEWEVDSVDPWEYQIGTGVKAFPVYNHLELTGTMQVLP
jgi:Phage major capsid protein E